MNTLSATRCIHTQSDFIMSSLEWPYGHFRGTKYVYVQCVKEVIDVALINITYLKKPCQAISDIFYVNLSYDLSECTLNDNSSYVDNENHSGIIKTYITYREVL